ncbi:DUF460 domain-containing protein [Candidatus Woesearchaeota archaeon]|nr:DUF460 domain-containing protein [Candidatus Woesearchaeota archaeon]
MDMKPLIVGVDPGTTVGYAAIDFDGMLVKADSAKELDLGTLIAKLIPLGKVLLVGADKEKNPEYVEKLAIKLGARLSKPEYDLKVEEKREMARDYATKNQHEVDAVASAVSAFKRIRPVLQKIDYLLEAGGKMQFREQLITLVVGKELNIRDAMELLEEPEKEEKKIIREVVEKKKLAEEDFLSLFTKLQRAEREIKLLRQQNGKLGLKLGSLQKDFSVMLARSSRSAQDRRMAKLLSLRESRIRAYDAMVRQKDGKLLEQEGSIAALYFFLSHLKDNCILKKLENLGTVEFEKKSGLLNIGQGDVLLVKDVEQFSQKAIGQLKGKVSTIIYKKPISQKTKERLPFLLIDASKMGIEEAAYFGLVSKESLDNARKEASMLHSLVDNYQKERKASLLQTPNN